jgi:prepilin signal peptidase PulO-like enzyme (type II secretory pathway)
MQALSEFVRAALIFCGVMLWSTLIFTRATRVATLIAPLRIAMPPLAWSGAVILAAVAAYRGPHAAPTGCVCIALIAAGVVDARTGYLIDAITFPAGTIALGAALASGRTHEAFLGILESAGLAGFVFVISRGRAIGLGDVKALYSLGAAFGPSRTALVLLAASLSGLTLALVRGSCTRGAEVRFGPHLAAGAAFTFLSAEG